MSKYENVLHMETENSASIILKNVRAGTEVLEFGAGNGYMTKYMHEALGCEVFAVELDETHIGELDKHTEGYLVGNPDGDIEKYNWVGCGVFDYILFADVLEHLRDPLTVLKKSAELLYEGGSILISVPNVSHNSIIIDLINNNFEYRELGLLDNTHIHLFARKSLLKMVGDAGLKVVKEMNTRCAVDKTEFGNKLSDVPKEVHQYLNKRLDGNIYQFIWELRLR